MTATVAAALRAATAQLTQVGIVAAAGDARHLVAHAIGLDPDRLTLHLSDQLDASVQVRLEAALAARARHQPVSQIIGSRLFWGRRFRVTRDVLDPRPETECLIAAALAQPFARVLDLGTGSGAILLTLLAERPDASGLGTDLSPKALAVALGNAQALGLTARASFARADWLDGVQEQFDLIVANPPYIAAAEIAGLAPEVRDWEPHLALTPGGDGLGAYRRIAAGAGVLLAPGGVLLLEIGPTQSAAVTALLTAAGLRCGPTLPDLDGRDRVVVARLP